MVRHTQLLSALVDLDKVRPGVSAVGVGVSDLGLARVVELARRQRGSNAGEGSSHNHGELHLENRKDWKRVAR